MTDNDFSLPSDTSPCPGFAYCVFCESGRDDIAAENVLKGLHAFAISPKVEKEECHSGVWEKCLRRMLPGYVFVYSDVPVPVSELVRVSGILRVLKYNDGDYRLKGADRLFAEWVHAHGGMIGMSLAVKDGTKIRVADGPLKDYEGSIVEVKRQKRIAKVAIRLGDVTRYVWMGFEWLRSVDKEDNADE
ncbi:MAG: hypothetical protein K6F68_00260 [Clostridiales bacterium]|nr:hypothetical protein [Clostridiales bacterium]